MNKKRCLSCQTDLRVIALIAFDPEEMYKQYRFYSCTTCSLLQIDPMPKNHNRHMYYSYKNSVKHIIEKNPQVTFIRALPYLSKLLALYTSLTSHLRYLFVKRFVKHGSVLDIGCSGGNFLDRFNAPSWKVTGVEINPSLAAIARSRLPYARIIKKPIESITVGKQRFDVISLWHVFEHLSNPKQVVKKIYSLLQTNGYLFIEVPHSDSLNRKIFGQHWQLLLLPQHLHFWSKKSLTYLLQQGGFQILDISYHGVLGFSTSSSLANLLRSKGIRSNVAIFFAYCLFPISLIYQFLSLKRRENILVVAKKKTV